MTERVYADYDSLAEEMVSVLEEVDTVACIAKYDHAKYIISNLIKKGVDVDCINIHAAEYGYAYDDAYLISIDDDFEIICEPLIVDGDVVEYISDVVFIHGDCNMSYLTTNWTDEPDVVAFEMDWEYEDDDDCYDEQCDCEDCEYYDEYFGCDENEEDFDDNGLYLAVNNDTDEVVGFKYVFEDEYGTSEYTYFAYDPDDVRDALNRFMRGMQ